MRAVIAIIGVVLSAQCAAAQDRIYVSSAGDEYAATSNADGTVLTSLYPKVRFEGVGASAVPVRGIERVYFGRDCDAFHAVFGTGIWGYANGGFVAEFEDFSIGFPRQGLIPLPNTACRL